MSPGCSCVMSIRSVALNCRFTECGNVTSLSAHAALTSPEASNASGPVAPCSNFLPTCRMANSTTGFVVDSGSCATWVAASLVPTFRTGLLFSWSADLIAIIALLGSARFFQALAGLDVGTSFGGIGSSREVMIASLAEPAMIMIVFTVALIAGSTQLSTMAGFLVSSEVGLRVSLGLALLALVMVAIAENARIPVDNPATHLELTMVHEAMVLEYSGRHLALIELASSLKLLLYVSLIACLFAPWGLATRDETLAAPAALLIGVGAYLVKLAVGGGLLALFETSVAKMRVFRVPEFLGAALMLGLLATLLLFVSRSL